MGTLGHLTGLCDGWALALLCKAGGFLVDWRVSRTQMNAEPFSGLSVVLM